MTTLEATRTLAAGELGTDQGADRARGSADASFAAALSAATGEVAGADHVTIDDTDAPDGAASSPDAAASTSDGHSSGTGDTADPTAADGAASGAGHAASAGQAPEGTTGGSGGGPPATTLGRMLGLPPVPFGAVADAMPSTNSAGVQSLAGTSGDISSTTRGAHPVISAAEQYLGVPYKWGGTDPATGFDCSGFVQRAFADIGIDLPRVSADQARVGTEVPSLTEARPGDLVYWAGQGGSPNHIGIYLGDGEMLHAPRRGEDVQVDSVRSQPPTTIRRVG